MLAVLFALPVAGLALLVAEPDLDVRWEHHPSHFWLVLGAGVINGAPAYATGTAARVRGDARVFLVSLAFLSAAGFLGLHALATPGVLLTGPNAGFSIATPTVNDALDAVIVGGGYVGLAAPPHTCARFGHRPAQQPRLSRSYADPRGLQPALVITQTFRSVPRKRMCLPSSMCGSRPVHPARRLASSPARPRALR